MAYITNIETGVAGQTIKASAYDITSGEWLNMNTSSWTSSTVSYADKTLGNELNENLDANQTGTYSGDINFPTGGSGTREAVMIFYHDDAAPTAPPIGSERVRVDNASGTVYPTIADQVSSNLLSVIGTPASGTIASNIEAIDTVVDAIKAKTDNLPADPADASDIAAAFSTVNSTLTTIGNYIDTEVSAIKTVTDALTAAAAAKLATSAGQMITFTVDNSVLTPTTTQFECDDITEATADHYKDRVVIFTSGALAGQAKAITAYAKVGSNGRFTVGTLTEAPANNDTGIII